ncbi:MAG: hypothetical protein ACTHLA_04195 [Asticcacaulis sp.]|uniref:hypothetical protein n=1 Tax=Asticcacaulis sp. TaxID=1872648 RepID=UPI003F7C5944
MQISSSAGLSLSQLLSQVSSSLKASSATSTSGSSSASATSAASATTTSSSSTTSVSDNLDYFISALSSKIVDSLLALQTQSASAGVSSLSDNRHRHHMLGAGLGQPVSARNDADSDGDATTMAALNDANSPPSATVGPQGPNGATVAGAGGLSPSQDLAGLMQQFIQALQSYGQTSAASATTAAASTTSIAA